MAKKREEHKIDPVVILILVFIVALSGLSIFYATSNNATGATTARDTSAYTCPPGTSKQITGFFCCESGAKNATCYARVEAHLRCIEYRAQPVVAFICV